MLSLVIAFQIVKYTLMKPLGPVRILEWYEVIILSTQLSGIVKPGDSFPGVVFSLNNNESSNKYFSANVSIPLTAALGGSNLLHAKLKNSIFKVWTI